ncbi:VTT domain-containing protein [Chloroflexota bacterium]
MNRSKGSGNVSGDGRRKIWLRKNLIPVLTLLFIVVISVALFVYGHDPERVAELQSYGYSGAFLVSLVGNATVLLPGIVLPILSGLGVVFYQGIGLVGPVAVGLAGGAGAAIGEIVGYMAGYSGRGIVENNRLYDRLVAWVRRWGVIAIFIFTLVPLFFDLVGIAAGVLRFPLWKFVLICWLGRTLLYVVVVIAIALGWEVLLPVFS